MENRSLSRDWRELERTSKVKARSSSSSVAELVRDPRELSREGAAEIWSGNDDKE